MSWYMFLTVDRILIAPYTETRQEFFYATGGLAMKAWISGWSDSRLFSYNAGTKQWTEVHRELTY